MAQISLKYTSSTGWTDNLWPRAKSGIPSKEGFWRIESKGTGTVATTGSMSTMNHLGDSGVDFESKYFESGSHDV